MDDLNLNAYDGYLIRPMEETDLDSVMKIELECFTIPWAKSNFLRELNENAHAFYIVVLNEGEIVGYAGMWHIINEGHITNVAVAEAHRHAGIGDLLVKSLLKIARDMEMIGLTLEVRISNARAQKLYTRNGFKPEGFRKNYYEDTKEDAVIMWKYL